MRLILARFCKLAKFLHLLRLALGCSSAMLLVLDWPGDKSVLWWFNMILIKIITIYAVVDWMMVFNRYHKFWMFYNDLLVVLAIEQRRISKGSSPAPHQWRLPPPSSRVSCMAAWTQVLMLMLVSICVFFFASMFVVEIFSHPITVCDLIFSFPRLWLFFEIFSYMKV